MKTKFKIGQCVEANERSNFKYLFTNRKHGFWGIVVDKPKNKTRLNKCGVFIKSFKDSEVYEISPLCLRKV